MAWLGQGWIHLLFCGEITCYLVISFDLSARMCKYIIIQLNTLSWLLVVVNKWGNMKKVKAFDLSWCKFQQGQRSCMRFVYK